MTTPPLDEPMAIRSEVDAVWLSEEARRLAAAVGLTPQAQWEVAIAVSELVTNAARHGGGGLLWFHPLPASLEVIVEDDGPGLRALDAVLQPRDPLRDPRRSGSLGAGLSAVQRLTDELRLEPGQQLRGARLVIRKYRPPAR